MFDFCEDDLSIKKLYKKLSTYLHPDKGGEHDLMVLLNSSYELALNNIKTKEKINKQMPKYENQYEDIMFEENDPRLEIVKEIREYAELHPSYKLDFLESIIEYAKNNGFITSGQYNALVRSYYTFRMHEKKKPKANAK